MRKKELKKISVNEMVEKGKIKDSCYYGEGYKDYLKRKNEIPN